MNDIHAPGTRPVICVTGASGFIGSGMVSGLPALGLRVRPVGRNQPPAGGGDGVEPFVRLKGYADPRALEQAFGGSNCILHLADNPHRAGPRAASHAEGAADIAPALVQAMRAARVHRLILASSVYAGASGPLAGGYGAAKRQIEDQLLSATDLQVIVLRLPPIYGPGGGGGFASLARAVGRGTPLPLGMAHAQRAYLSRTNLVSLVAAIAMADAHAWEMAKGRIFEPSDGQPISTRDLARAIGRATGRPARLLPVPPGVLVGVAAIMGRREMVEGAIGPLSVGAPDELERIFGWRPVEEMPGSLGWLGSGADPQTLPTASP